jgi:hypothetical protein
VFFCTFVHLDGLLLIYLYILIYNSNVSDVTAFRYNIQIYLMFYIF